MDSSFDVAEFVAASRDEQGLPPKVEDVGALTAIIALLGTAAG